MQLTAGRFQGRLHVRMLGKLAQQARLGGAVRQRRVCLQLWAAFRTPSTDVSADVQAKRKAAAARVEKQIKRPQPEVAPVGKHSPADEVNRLVSQRLEDVLALDRHASLVHGSDGASTSTASSDSSAAPAFTRPTRKSRRNKSETSVVSYLAPSRDLCSSK